MSARAFCTVEASTKRNSDLGSGRTGTPATNVVGLLCTPLWPVSREIVNVLELNSPREYLECYHVPAAGVALPDVREGDVLVHGGAEYRIAYAGEWTDNDVPCLVIVAQQIKGT
jgi:hypothetical protein